MRRFVLAAAAMIAWFAPVASAEECKPLQRYGVAPFEFNDTGNISLAASVGGRNTHLVLDTGAYWSSIRRDLAEALNLRIKKSYALYLIDLSGEKQDDIAMVPDVKVGSLNFGTSEYFIDKIDPETPMQDFGGLLGQNLLTQVDLEIDIAHKTIALFSQDHCDGDGVYWADEAVVLKYKRQPARPPLGTRIKPDVDKNQIDPPIVTADIEGEAVSVLFDTGASFTSMDLELARRRFGITLQTPGVEPYGKVYVASGAALDCYKYTFKSLTIAGIRFENVPVILANFDEISQVILGMNEMKHLHLYFAFREGVIYVTAADAGRTPPPH